MVTETRCPWIASEPHCLWAAFATRQRLVPLTQTQWLSLFYQLNRFFITASKQPVMMWIISIYWLRLRCPTGCPCLWTHLFSPLLLTHSPFLVRNSRLSKNRKRCHSKSTELKMWNYWQRPDNELTESVLKSDPQQTKAKRNPSCRSKSQMCFMSAELFVSTGSWLRSANCRFVCGATRPWSQTCCWAWPHWTSVTRSRPMTWKVSDIINKHKQLLYMCFFFLNHSIVLI